MTRVGFDGGSPSGQRQGQQLDSDSHDHAPPLAAGHPNVLADLQRAEGGCGPGGAHHRIDAEDGPSAAAETDTKLLARRVNRGNLPHLCESAFPRVHHLDS